MNIVLIVSVSTYVSLMTFEYELYLLKVNRMTQSPQGASLFADCDGLLSELSATDEAVLTGGGGCGGYGGSKAKGSKKGKSKKGKSGSGGGYGGCYYYCY